MTLTQLRYFIAIADSGLNVTVAAEGVHATVSGLLKQIKQLEDQLGFLLFTRKGRSLDGISHAGQKILGYARRIIEEANNIRSYSANERSDDTGRLTLSTSHMLARHVLPSAVVAIKLRFPNVRVDLRIAADIEVLPRLARGDVDLALVSTAGQRPVGGVAVPLFRWERVVLIPGSHPLAALQRAPALVELAEHPLVIYESSDHSDSSLRRTFARAGIQPVVSVSTRDASLIDVYVRAGLGAGVLAEMALSSGENFDLNVLPTPAELPECITWAVIPRGRVLRDYALDFLQHLAPQLDRIEVRRVLQGNLEPNWPVPPSWAQLHQCATDLPRIPRARAT